MRTILSILAALIGAIPALAQSISATHLQASSRLQIPVGTTSATSVAGSVAIDTDGDGVNLTQGMLSFHDGTRIMYGVFVDSLPTVDDYVLAYDTTAKKFVFQAQAGGGGSVSSSRLVATQHSLTGGGDLSADRTLSLVNDSASPGANKVYGTDGSGVRGWKADPAGGGSGYGGTSTSSVSFGTGLKSWTTQTGLAYVVGARVRAIETGFSQWMEGTVTTYSGGTLTINVDLLGGVGTYSNWSFSVAGVQGETGSMVSDGDYGDVSILSGTMTVDNGAIINAKMANMSASTIKARVTGSTGAPEDATLSQVLDFVGSAAQGDILYRGASTWTRLGAGTSGQFLKTQGTGANPLWASVPGGGDALTSNPLSQFAATTSAQLASVLSNESGTGLAVFNDGATLTNVTINGISILGTPGSSLNVGGGGTLGSAAYTATSAYQAADGELAAIAGLTSAADTLPYFTGAGTAGTASLTAAGRSLIGGANAAAQRTTLGLAIGTDVQAFDSDISAVAGLSTSGLMARTGAGTAAARTLTAPAAGVTVSNGDGVSGNPTLALANDLSAVEGLSGTGIARRTGTDAWSVGTTVSIAEGGTGQTSAKAAFDALNGAEATVASSSTTDIGAASSDKVSITGTTTITSFGTATAGIERQGRFTGSLILTYNATSLILPGGGNITTAAGDSFRAYSLGSGNWVVVEYVKANGQSVKHGVVPIASKSADYTLVITDAGFTILHPSSDANSRTFTIPSNASVPFDVGTVVTWYNDSASTCTIAITSDTLTKAGAGTTGSVSLPSKAIATAQKITSTSWVITGNGI